MTRAGGELSPVGDPGAGRAYRFGPFQLDIRERENLPPVALGSPLESQRRRAVAGQRRGGAVSTPLKDGQEMDKSADQRIGRCAKLLLELVELTGIEPVTS